MSNNEKQYLDLCRHVLAYGEEKDDRTKTGTYSLFGAQMRFNLGEGFPLLTTKKINFKLIVSELLWFIKGDTNILFLLVHGNNIWNEWAFKRYAESEAYTGKDMTDFGRRALTDTAFNETYQKEMAAFKTRILTDDDFAARFGDLGPVYGKQWRNWTTSRGETIDQLKQVIASIKNDPNSRRHLVTAWNPEDVKTNVALPPCHTLFQFYVSQGKLSCMLYQRSADLFLGVPFNIASYSLLVHLIANETGLEVGEFVHTIGDAHIYQNHVGQIKTQLNNKRYKLPTINISKDKSIFDLTCEDITLTDYVSHEAIKAPVSV